MTAWGWKHKNRETVISRQINSQCGKSREHWQGGGSQYTSYPSYSLGAICTSALHMRGSAQTVRLYPERIVNRMTACRCRLLVACMSAAERVKKNLQQTYTTAVIVDCAKDNVSRWMNFNDHANSGCNRCTLSRTELRFIDNKNGMIDIINENDNIDSTTTTMTTTTTTTNHNNAIRMVTIMIIIMIITTTTTIT